MLKKIKNTIRDYLIVLFFLTGIPYLRYIYLRNKKRSLLRVLAFHDVESRSHFDRLVSFLDDKFNIISPTEFKQNQLKKGCINIMLTFDDGYESWIENVVPVLKQQDLKGLFFISSGFVEAGEKGKEKDYLQERLGLKNYRPPLSWRHLAELKDAGMEIGGHTIDHSNLARTSKERTEKEIQEDKQILEEKLDQEIDCFAYPFGHRRAINQEVVEQIKEAGYSYAFTTNIDFNLEGVDEYKLNRDCIDSRDSLLLNTARIYGGYDSIKELINFFYGK